MFKETIRRYEHKRDHPFAKGFGGGANMTLAGAVPFALAVHYEDLKGARRGWRIMIDAWRDVAKEVRAGRTTWQNMLYEVFALHIMPSGLLAAGEIETETAGPEAEQRNRRDVEDQTADDADQMMLVDEDGILRTVEGFLADLESEDGK